MQKYDDSVTAFCPSCDVLAEPDPACELCDGGAAIRVTVIRDLTFEAIRDHWQIPSQRFKILQHLQTGVILEDGSFLCDGCAVNELHEHRCHGIDGERACECRECDEEDSPR